MQKIVCPALIHLDAKILLVTEHVHA